MLNMPANTFALIALVMLVSASVLVGALIYAYMMGQSCSEVNHILSERAAMLNRFERMAQLIVQDERSRELGQVISDMRSAGRVSPIEAIRLYEKHCGEARRYKWLGTAALSPASQALLLGN